MTRNSGLLSGAAAWRIIPETIFFTAVALVVTLVSKKTDHSLGITNQILTVMGAVLGLVVTFRTSSAYDRYWEARKLWATINMQSRNLARLVWIHVPPDRVDKNAETQTNGVKPNLPESVVISEKGSAMLLVEAYSIAVKHALRGERGFHYEDLHHLVASIVPASNRQHHSLAHYWSPSSTTLVGSLERAAARDRPVPSRSTTMSSVPMLKSPDTSVNNKETDAYSAGRKICRTTSLEGQRPKKTGVIFHDPFAPDPSPPASLAPAHQGPHRCHIREWFPLAFRALFQLGFQFAKAAQYLFRRANRVPASENDSIHSDLETTSDDLNVPLQITIHLSSYVQWLLKNDLIKPAIALGFTNSIVALEDTTLQLDRIKTTPIPSAYQDHLRLSLWLYMFFFPFQVLETLGYFTILATALYAYVLLGFMEIGRDLENPFTYLMNNLDLDHFCQNIKRDLQQVASHYGPEGQLSHADASLLQASIPPHNVVWRI